MTMPTSNAAPKFSLNDSVNWSSSAGGVAKAKAGVVAEVLPAGQLPSRDRFLALRKEVSMPRDHESYVVLVGKKAYWPRVKALTPGAGTAAL